jgi:hypothetical protein
MIKRNTGTFHMDKTNRAFFPQKINLFFYEFKFLKFLYDKLFSYGSEIIQILACDNYDGFQHLSFIFSKK